MAQFWDAVLEGFSRVLFVSAWANAEEEAGRTYPGMKLEEVAPETPPVWKSAAGDWLREIERRNPVLGPSPLHAAYLATEQHRSHQLDSPEAFGNCLAFECMGDGVSWEDDHDPHRLELPMIEAHIDYLTPPPGWSCVL